MKVEIILAERGKGNVPIGIVEPPRRGGKLYRPSARASVILKGDREIIKEVEKLIETADKWDIS